MARLSSRIGIVGAVVLLCSAVSLGCAHPEETAPPALPAPGANGQYSVAWPDLGAGEDRFITFYLGDSLETCRQLSPKFPFDSTHTRAQDHTQLLAFVSCMNHPRMADRTVLLVGRTDDRGPPDYNVELGLKRAERIKQLLIADGLAANRIEVESKGEAGAIGQTPGASYGYDRRVDVIVKGGAHVPGVPAS